MLFERSPEHGNEISVCFIAFEKAFCRINLAIMSDKHKKIVVAWKDGRLIMNVYLNKKERVRIIDQLTEQCEIGRGGGGSDKDAHHRQPYSQFM